MANNLDEQEIYEEIEDPNILFEEVSKYIKNEEEVERIKDAYFYAEKKHFGQKRKSGANFIVHPLTCAYFLAQWKMNTDTIIAGLLHDVVEDTPVSVAEISSVFGENISNMVDSVSKTSYLTKSNRQKIKNQYLEKLIFNTVKDINVIFVKLADRLSNVITLQYMKPEKQVIIAQETLDIYVSIANRIGMKKARESLEEICFKIINPEAYEKLSAEIDKDREVREKLIKEISLEILKALDSSSIFNTKVFGRYKTKYSIFNKMKRRNKSLLDIGDILAYRIITSSEMDCYLALSVVHKLYTPITGKFKDYIATPKNNMYQSLHTTVITKDGMIFEVQIRTNEMNDVAESGLAAHWTYKKGEENLSEDQKQKRNRERAVYLNDVLSISDELNKLAGDYNNELIEQNVVQNVNEVIKKDFLLPIVYVISKEGKVYNFPYGSTVLDYSYKVWENKAHNTSGAMINGDFCSIETVLKNGDNVEALFEPGIRPDESWLHLVKSTDAKNFIKEYLELKEKDRISYSDLSDDEMINIAKENIKKYADDHKIELDNDSFNIRKKILTLNYSSKDIFLIDVAKNIVSIEDAVKILSTHNHDKEENLDEVFERLNRSRKLRGVGRNDVLIKNKIEGNCFLSYCCSPNPVDKICGLRKDDTIFVHRNICHAILSIPKESYDKEVLDATWISANTVNNNYFMKMEVTANKGFEVISSIIETSSKLNIKVLEAISSLYNKEFSNLDGVEYNRIIFQLNGSNSIDNIEDELRKVRGVIKVFRPTGFRPIKVVKSED